MKDSQKAQLKALAQEMKDCPECDGEGDQLYARRDDFTDDWPACNTCAGTGRVLWFSELTEICMYCAGVGHWTDYQTRPMTVQYVPRGVECWRCGGTGRILKRGAELLVAAYQCLRRETGCQDICVSISTSLSVEPPGVWAVAARAESGVICALGKGEDELTAAIQALLALA